MKQNYTSIDIKKLTITEALTTQTFMFKPAELQTSVSTKTTTKHFPTNTLFASRCDNGGGRGDRDM